VATASISGLGSGLDTAGIVSQLMQLEAVPQTKLKNRVSSEESVVKALQSLNTKFAALATKAADLSSSAWDSLAATSSLAGVTVTAGVQATAASFSVKVNALATSHGETYTSTATPTDVVVPEDGDGKRTLTINHADGATKTVDTGDGTLKSVVAALNDPANATGVRATMLQVTPGNYRLVVDATATGTESSFTIASSEGALLGGPEAARTRTGKDAEIEVSGFTLTSRTNTFTDLMPGVSVTLGAGAEVGKTAEVSVSRDATKQVAAVKSYVDSVNALLTEIDNLTKYDSASGSSGVLSGDSSARALRTALATSLYPADGSSMASMGLQTDRYGKLVFDEETFKKAYEADPVAVAKAYDSTDGFAARVKKVADNASDKYTGTLTSLIQGRQDGIARLNASIEAWDLRLELREATLSRQFSALDVALANMSSQSSWLTSQISALSSSSS